MRARLHLETLSKNSDTGQATPRIEMDRRTPRGTRELRNLAEPSIWDAPRQDVAKEEGRVLRSMVESNQDAGNIAMDEFFGNIALVAKDPETLLDTSKDTSGYDYKSQNGKGGIGEDSINNLERLMNYNNGVNKTTNSQRIRDAWDHPEPKVRVKLRSKGHKSATLSTTSRFRRPYWCNIPRE